jgi:hypothetical protein
MGLDPEVVVPGRSVARPLTAVTRPMVNGPARTEQAHTGQVQTEQVQTEDARTEQVQSEHWQTEQVGAERAFRGVRSQMVGRWAALALGLVVVVETGWLIIRPAGDRRGVATERRASANDDQVATAKGTESSIVQNPAANTESAPATTSGAVTDSPIPTLKSSSASAQASSRTDQVTRVNHLTAVPEQPPSSQATSPARAPALAEPGWVSIPISIQVQVFENGRFVGTNDANKIPLAAGRHELELVNESLHYKAPQRVEIPSGRGATLAVSLPSGTLHLNAVPWAEVLIDGQSAGQTPLGNVQVAIGPHQIAFRHPSLGEQTRSIVVGVGSATRVAVDFSK